MSQHTPDMADLIAIGAAAAVIFVLAIIGAGLIAGITWAHLADALGLQP